MVCAAKTAHFLLGKPTGCVRNDLVSRKGNFRAGGARKKRSYAIDPHLRSDHVGAIHESPAPGRLRARGMKTVQNPVRRTYGADGGTGNPSPTTPQSALLTAPLTSSAKGGCVEPRAIRCMIVRKAIDHAGGLLTIPPSFASQMPPPFTQGRHWWVRCRGVSLS